MFKHSVLLAAAATLLFAALKSEATILFEPYAGYMTGDLKLDVADTHPDTSMRGNTYTGSVDGFAYGGKLALIYDSIFIGGEYQSTRAKEKLNNSDTLKDWSNTSIFGIVGLQFAQGLRLSVGMTVSPHRSEETNATNPIIYTGSAKKVSLGFRYRMPFAINADYIMYDLKKFKDGATEGDVKERFDQMKYSAFLFSISFPFEFGGGAQ